MSKKILKVLEKDSCILNLRKNNKNEMQIAKIYFRTNKADLGVDDINIMTIICKVYSLALISYKIHFKIVGHADIRGKLENNWELSKHRTEAVKDFLDNRLGGKNGSSNYYSSILPLGEIDGGFDYAEDRRVDIIISKSLLNKPKPRREFNWDKPLVIESNYPYQYWCDNPDLFRPKIFRRFHPEYNLYWSDLYPFIVRIEKLHTIQQDDSAYIYNMNEKTRVAIIRLMDRYFSKSEINTAIGELNYGDLQNNFDELLSINFAIIERGQYDEAYRRMESEWDQSDFRYCCVFLAHKFGLVPRNTPYTKK